MSLALVRPRCAAFFRLQEYLCISGSLLGYSCELLLRVQIIDWHSGAGTFLGAAFLSEPTDAYEGLKASISGGLVALDSFEKTDGFFL